MSNKKVFQYSLLILLFFVSFLFYQNYFANNSEKSKSDKSKNLDVEKNWEPNQKQSEKNLIENLKYVSEDLLGNTYTVTAQSATLKEREINEVELFEVNAEISKKDQEVIYIYSKLPTIIRLIIILF